MKKEKNWLMNSAKMFFLNYLRVAGVQLIKQWSALIIEIFNTIFQF